MRLGYLLGWGVTRRYGFTRVPALRELVLGFLVGDRGGDDHVVAVLPVDRRGHLVAGGELQRVDHPQDLVDVAPVLAGYVMISLTFLSGPMMNTERTVIVSLAFGWIMS